MKMIHDESAATVTIESILLFAITILFFGMVMLSFNNINNEAREVVMKEQFGAMGNDIASKILDMDYQIKSSLSKGSEIYIEKELDIASKCADVPYMIELAEGEVIISSLGSPAVTVKVPFNPDVNVLAGSATASTEGEHVLVYDPNGQIMFKNGGLEPETDEIWPVIGIYSPSIYDNQSGIVTIKVFTWDDMKITKVEYYVDGTYMGPGVAPTYEWDWDTTPYVRGMHTVTAITYDRAGHYSFDSVSYFVDNGDLQDPTIEIVTPPDGSYTDFSRPYIKAIVRDDFAINASSIRMWINSSYVNATITELSYREFSVYYLPPSPLINATYNVRVDVADFMNNETTAIWNFTVIPITDSNPPFGSINFPIQDENLVSGSQIKVEYSALDNAPGDSGIDYIIVNMSRNSTLIYSKRVNGSVYPTVFKSLSGSVLFNETYILDTFYDYEVTVYDRAGLSYVDQKGPLKVLSGMASYLIVDYNDVNSAGDIVEFNVRSAGPTIDVNGITVTFATSPCKLKRIDFGGALWWSSASGLTSPASPPLGIKRVPVTDTAIKMTFSKSLTDPADDPLRVTMTFTDGTSRNLLIPLNP